MSSCINKNSHEYQSLLKRTGLAPILLRAFITEYADIHNGRWPTPAEIKGANTLEHAKEFLELSSTNSTDINNLQKKFGVQTIEEANILLNTQDTYNDLEFNIIPLQKTAIVKIENRPSEYTHKQSERYIPDFKVNSRLVFGDAFLKLSKLYNIQYNQVNLQDLHKDSKFKQVISVDPNPKAFILDGQIYINMDNYSVDSPVHELSHMLIGHLRFVKPELYMQLISLSEQLPEYQNLVRLFPGRTRNDINEEIFVSEYSKFITGQDSLFDNVNSDIKYQVQFQVNRMLDIILHGSKSVNDVEHEAYGDKSLKQIAYDVNSQIMTSYDQTLLEDSTIHRKINNMKSDLLKSGKLMEVCD